MELWIATTNQGKLNEFRNLLSSLNVQIHSVAELKTYATPKETGQSFHENARIKAKSLKALKPQAWVVADDSGLEVEGLGGMPGIHSARYAGERASDAENVAKVLKMLQIRSPRMRVAQLRCVLVAYDPQGNEHIIEGLIKGSIAQKVTGSAGFGYDPIFIPDGESRSFAEMGLAAKNQISHRALAIRQLSKLLQSHL